MNIQQRLDNLENKTVIYDPNFCACDKKTVYVPGDDPPPDICERCGKPLLIINISSAEMRGEIQTKKTGEK
jgi:rRNA maturation endonuclease Nob1